MKRGLLLGRDQIAGMYEMHSFVHRTPTFYIYFYYAVRILLIKKTIKTAVIEETVYLESVAQIDIFTPILLL